MRSAFLTIGLLLSAGALARGTGTSLWTRVSGGPGTRCAPGTPYAFFVHAGRPDRLLVYFAGGGACWSAKSCSPQQHAYNAAILSGNQPAIVGNVVSAGIFDFSNPRNPVRDYTIVFAPYCTGDVFLGNRVVTYPAPNPGATGVTIHYAGHADTTDVLDWVYAHATAPATVLVAGESAGAEASAAYAGLVADHYPHARVVQLEVSLGAFGARPIPGAWGASDIAAARPRFAGKDVSEISMNDFTVAAAERPNLTPAEYNTVDDGVQLQALQMFDPAVTAIQPDLARSLTELHVAVPRLRTYTAPGRGHTILATPGFYTLAVNGIRFRDWLVDLLEGREAVNVACGNCGDVHKASHSSSSNGSSGG